MIDDILSRLRGLTSDGRSARCPCRAHDDRNNSLSVGYGDDGRLLLYCHGGCSLDDILTAVGAEAKDLFPDKAGRGGGSAAPSIHRATAQRRPRALGADTIDDRAGLTLEQYSQAKAIPVESLTGWGLSEIMYVGKPAVRTPYYGTGGEELAVRFRPALNGKNRFRWRSGDKPCLYGLDRLAEAQAAGYVVLCEGESDVQTLWLHGIPALGIPGATNWREDRDAHHLDGIETIYVVIEPDKGGDAVKKWLASSTIRHRAKLLTLPVKDPSALHLEDAARLDERWQDARRDAVSWSKIEAEANAAERKEAQEQCSDLARSANILDEFDQDLTKLGLVGERPAAKLLFLAVTSRLLERPVSVAVKGPSSGGKSFVTETVLRFFPPAAFHALTAMSDRNLAYSEEPLRHRTLVIYEASGMASDIASYLIRTLLSEGHLKYEVVEKGEDGRLVSRLIEREGPTGLLCTTTAVSLHAENETRMLTLTITDTQAQTKAVFKALAQAGTRADLDLSRWHALQTWLSTGPTQVSIPYAEKLAELVPPVAVRLRRDFKTVLMLIHAHALLHQATRSKDEQGVVVAALEDYTAVRKLVADLVAEGVEATVKPQIREVVEATARLIANGQGEVRQVELKPILKLDKGAISRRVAGAIDEGFLKNLEERAGRPSRLVVGDPLPADIDVLPTPECLADRLRSCTVDWGDSSPSPPPPPDEIEPSATDEGASTPPIRKIRI